MKNPFTLGIVSNRSSFCNRSRELDDLLRNARNGSNVVLCSPRRFGKSSLVTVVLDELRKERFLTAYVDLFPISSEEDFVARFASAIFKGIGRGVAPQSFAEKVKGFFTSLRPVVEIGQDGYAISAKFDRSGRSQPPLDDLMDGLHKYVRDKNLPACIVLDEFQEITELPEAKRIEGTLRSHIQFQRGISYFFVGSKRRILQDMFMNRSRPFYKSAFLYALEPISSEDFIPYIEKLFMETGKNCRTTLAKTIYEKASGYPYYVQKLSSLAWDITDHECSMEIIEEALLMLVKSEAIDFEGLWGGLSLSQKSLLKALAIEPTTQPYAKEYLAQNHLSIGGAQKALNVLIVKDLIEKPNDGVYRLTDPIMTMWLNG